MKKKDKKKKKSSEKTWSLDTLLLQGNAETVNEGSMRFVMEMLPVEFPIIRKVKIQPLEIHTSGFRTSFIVQITFRKELHPKGEDIWTKKSGKEILHFLTGLDEEFDVGVMGHPSKKFST